uniref:Uncharacterized protein n=1 Tax=Eutreptiella gymnastica TaxID=73025 RepID=A0A7S4CI49_9EUGL
MQKALNVIFGQAVSFCQRHLTRTLINSSTFRSLVERSRHITGSPEEIKQSAQQKLTKSLTSEAPMQDLVSGAKRQSNIAKTEASRFGRHLKDILTGK